MFKHFIKYFYIISLFSLFLLVSTVCSSNIVIDTDDGIEALILYNWSCYTIISTTYVEHFPYSIPDTYLYGRGYLMVVPKWGYYFKGWEGSLPYVRILSPVGCEDGFAKATTIKAINDYYPDFMCFEPVLKKVCSEYYPNFCSNCVKCHKFPYDYDGHNYNQHLDKDLDGYTHSEGDCDDNNPRYNPGASDDGVHDYNCDGFVEVYNPNLNNSNNKDEGCFIKTVIKN